MRLLLIGLLLVLGFLPASVGAAPASAPFTIIVLPDTQKLTAYDRPNARRDMLNAQTRWIVQQREARNIVFVSHVGDIVDHGGAQPVEWQYADAALDRLDGVVPYAVVGGNHDPERPGSVKSGWESYLRWFGPDRFAGRAWFGGAAPDGLSTYQVFNAGGMQVLHLALELEVPDDAITWAQGVIDAHPGLPTIITTHAYLTDESRRTKDSEVQFDGNSGEAIWQQLIRPNPQIVLTLNGHFWQHGGVGRRYSTNAAGYGVEQLEANYQAYADGGAGYLRILTFDPAARTLRVQTYSPALDRYKNDAANQFTLNMSFSRFAATPSATSMPTATKTPTAATRMPTATATRTATAAPTATSAPTATRTATATPTATRIATAAPTATRTATAMPTATRTATTAPTATGTATATRTAITAPTATGTALVASTATMTPTVSLPATAAPTSTTVVAAPSATLAPAPVGEVIYLPSIMR